MFMKCSVLDFPVSSLASAPTTDSAPCLQPDSGAHPPSLPSEADCAEGWSPQRIELLRHHHTLGLSLSQSAEVLGGVTRNAVVSKRNRLGLAPQSKVASPNLPALPPYGRLGLVGCPEFRTEPLPAMDLPPPAAANPKRLSTRERGECAWPLGPAEQQGDYMTLFCCAPVEGRRPYCPDHAKRARRFQ